MTNNQNTSSLFRMTVGDHSVVGHPTPSDIKNTLRMLDESADGFMIMERGPKSFMQCSGTLKNGFYVEYRESGANQHFNSGDDSIELDMAIDLFTSYVREDNRWRETIAWEVNKPTSIGPNESPRNRSGLVERHGNAIVINKKFCLIASGLACYVLGTFGFFLLPRLGLRLGFRIPGLLIGLGTVCLIMSSFTDD